jgi:hypothetical protein
MFDGIALIKWRPNMYPLHRVTSHLSINGFSTNGNRPRSTRRGSVEYHHPRSPSRNSHDLSRTGTPSFHTLRFSEDEEIEEKDEFSYGFSNRRNSHDEDDDDEQQSSTRKPDDYRTRNHMVNPVGGIEARNKYYD